MAIRNAAKALVWHEGKVLVNRCRNEKGEVYYDLPGGGQNQYETMEEAVVHEVLEETGYTVEIRRQYPAHSHKIHHIFLCALKDDAKAPPSERDLSQEESLWISLSEADALPFYPVLVRGQIAALINGAAPCYLGCCWY